MEFFAEIVGWGGTVLVVGSYVAVQLRYLKTETYTYQICNLCGAIGVGINAWHYGAFPSLVIQAVWGPIALFALYRVLFYPKN